MFRRDRYDGYGGVLIAIKTYLNPVELTIPNSTCELLAAGLQIFRQPLVICGVYRPPNRDLSYMENLCSVVADLVSAHAGSTFWFAGDFNLPDIDMVIIFNKWKKTWKLKHMLTAIAHLKQQKW